MRTRNFLLLSASLLCLAVPAVADDWRQFRGPDSAGQTQETGLPVTWGADRNLAWKTPLPGPGTSSPIVVGNKIFLTCYTGYGLDKSDPGTMEDLKRHLLCLDRNGGKILWTRTVAALVPETPYASFEALHGYASSTPISDGERVYVFFGKTGLFAYNLKGEQLWQVNLGKSTNGWGSATSPVLYKDLLIVNASVESGALVALDKKTGKEVWRVKGISSSWSTPVLVSLPWGETELVVSGSKKILGFEPDTGKELWHANSFNWYVCPSVVAHDGVVYALQNSTCVAVRAGGRGDVTATHTVWQKNFGATVTSPVYSNGYLYFATSLAYCLKADDGSVVYKERLKPNLDDVYASPLAGDGKIYYVSRTKGTYVVEAGSKLRLLAHNTLDDDSVFNGSPAVSNGQLLLRSDRALYCIGQGR